MRPQDICKITAKAKYLLKMWRQGTYHLEMFDILLPYIHNKTRYQVKNRIDIRKEFLMDLKKGIDEFMKTVILTFIVRTPYRKWRMNWRLE